MDVKLLGTMEVGQNGRMIDPTATKVRKVFALLAINAGKLVTVPALVEEVWDSAAPRTALQTLQTYIMRLRRYIQDTAPPGSTGAGKAMLATRPGGYVLDIPEDDVDVHRYERLSVAGERALEASEFESAANLFGEALEIWRGPVLVDIHVGPLLAMEVTRLEQHRLGVLESRIDADLRLGRHHRLLGELAELTVRNPLHEKLCEQYMTALYASGMTVRALETFRTLRSTLVGELGIEPSYQVQNVHRAILQAGKVPGQEEYTCARCHAAA